MGRVRMFNNAWNKHTAMMLTIRWNFKYLYAFTICFKLINYTIVACQNREGETVKKICNKKILWMEKKGVRNLGIRNLQQSYHFLAGVKKFLELSICRLLTPCISIPRIKSHMQVRKFPIISELTHSFIFNFDFYGHPPSFEMLHKFSAEALWHFRRVKKR